MFPLADARGRVLGFGARAMRDDQGAKYINTAEGELYHKGRQLFGIDRARAAVAKAQRVIVVEGYTDVLALHDAGMSETVASWAPPLTKEQMAELARLVGTDGTVYLALDADRSGQEAMLRAARLAEDRACRCGWSAARGHGPGGPGDRRGRGRDGRSGRRGPLCA